MKVRQAVIMVGGLGTRLRPLTDTCPKPILPVLDRPCLDYLIDSMTRGGIEHIILACGYRSEQIPKAIGDGSDRGILIEYSFEDEPMGTAGAIKLLEDRLDDVFVATNGDVFADIDLKEEIDEHIRTDASITISLTAVKNPCEFGIARTDNKGRILEFREKPKPEEVFSDLINAGVYVVNKKVLESVPKDRMYDFSKDLVTDLLLKGHHIQGHRISGVWKDVGRPSDLLDTNLIMAGKIGTKKIIDPVNTSIVHIGGGSKITGSELSATIVSKGSEISNSKLRRTMIMKDSKIHGSEISNSIIGNGCVVIGCTLQNMVIGDGTVLTNEKLIGTQKI